MVLFTAVEARRYYCTRVKNGRATRHLPIWISGQDSLTFATLSHCILAEDSAGNLVLHEKNTIDTLDTDD
jgi:hypothetical protein